MGDSKALTKARIELEELYRGIPDESVNLTFKDLAQVQTKVVVTNKSPDHNKITPHLTKLPSLDFSRALQQSSNKHHLHDHHDAPDSPHFAHHHHYHGDHQTKPMHASKAHQTHVVVSPRSSHRALERSMVYDDDVSVMSMASGYHDRAQRRRPGIPHSNICTICSTYIYIFRHRCLVCGRVYCRECVSMGMGEMAEGRKCIPCLGRRFSPRYIGRAGRVSCCWRYQTSVKQAELKWAERGPGRVGEKRGGGFKGRSGIEMSRSRSPEPAVMSATSINTTPSFVASSPYSPYTLNHYHHAHTHTHTHTLPL